MVWWSFLDFVFYCRLLLVVIWLVGQKLTSKSFLLLVLAWYAHVLLRVAAWELAFSNLTYFILRDSNLTALSVINLVISKSSPYSKIDLFILDILNLLESPIVCGVSYSHRRNNMVVHSLVKLTFSFSYKTIWIANFPLFVENFASVDLASL
ncbi:hypothetical protein ACOSQ2_025566 [Xanthoceras sorbifolium]